MDCDTLLLSEACCFGVFFTVAVFLLKPYVCTLLSAPVVSFFFVFDIRHCFTGGPQCNTGDCCLSQVAVPLLTYHLGNQI